MHLGQTSLPESTMNTPMKYIFLDTDDHFPETRPSEVMVEWPHDTAWQQTFIKHLGLDLC